MISRNLLPKLRRSQTGTPNTEEQFDRVVAFYNDHSELRPWVRYLHPVTGSMKRSLGRDCEDGMRLMERSQ
jgi:hypothetical protein